ncbi:DUF3788 domain-containing protein [Faecalicatena sp. AGMB00832]|uniref:DUF3788 domain-containing protein n=1 Tax=Faecalicatena faecalis TaxID=2726362 RepID=A0ABS6D6U9_9FIRM|nr:MULTISPECIES: DUF3788 domain-containing protein [Faecalicatena]MBU3877193.1 DUF3788 domain-containing protein [Faecalicatena faecalis]MCI6467263.1 DUF3788 domain-containing protein [Faecalicatena sp.]MDY5620268.1 DUF3788 domain-containing protein [Lachnospiraceae bacterium]
MIDIKNIDYTPDIHEISEYIGNPLFGQFYQYMQKEYKALCKIEYSKDVWARGWNIKLRKAGKGLCVIYPKEQYFTVLVVVGNKEKESVENILPQLSEEIQEIYHTTKEGNGQRWLMIDLKEKNQIYEDTLELIRIRRESK